MLPRVGIRVAGLAALISLTFAAGATGAGALTFSKLGAELSAPRYYPMVATLPNGKVLIAGGGQEGGTEFESAELFDPASSTFTPLAATMTIPREEAGAVLLPEGKVLLAGGYGGSKPGYLKSAELFDPATGTFEAIAANMVSERDGPAAALLPSGQVLIAGGYDDETETYTQGAETYDPATRTFSPSPVKLVGGSYAPAFGALPNGKVLIVGGYASSLLKSVATAELVDAAAGTATAVGQQALEPRNEPGHAVLGNGNVVIMGGENQHLATHKILRSVEVFNWETESFAAAGELVEPRDGGEAALLQDGRVLIVGGYDGELASNKYLKSAEVSAVTPAALATGPASGVSTGAASLSATATSEAAVTTFFQYGTTSAYGAATAKQSVAASNKALPFGAGVTGLTPGTTFHFRAVGENAGGVVYGADQTFTTATVASKLTASTLTAPTLTAVSQSHARWRAGSKLAQISRKAPVGTVFSFTLDEAATVTATFSQSVAGRKVKGHCVAPSHRNRHNTRCRRSVGRGALTLSGHAGVDHLTFQGRVTSTRRLRPGTYTVTIAAVNAAGQRSSAKRLTFTIVR